MEESFLQRNYGKDYGELYKPDSTDMGGGRGNGEKFDMDAFLNDFESKSTDNTTSNTRNENNNSNAFPQMPNDNQNEMQGGQMPGEQMQGGGMKQEDGNTKTIAVMRVFGYSQKDCCKSILGGYRLMSYIGLPLEQCISTSCFGLWWILYLKILRVFPFINLIFLLCLFHLLFLL